MRETGDGIPVRLLQSQRRNLTPTNNIIEREHEERRNTK